MNKVRCYIDGTPINYDEFTKLFYLWPAKIETNSFEKELYDWFLNSPN